MLTRVVVWGVFVLAVAVFCLVRPQAARFFGSQGVGRHSPRYSFDRRTRAEGLVVLGHRLPGGNARKPASPAEQRQLGHPATAAAETHRPPPLGQPHPVRWIGRCLDR